MEPVSLVFDIEESALVDAPRFDRVFAGVENTLLQLFLFSFFICESEEEDESRKRITPIVFIRESEKEMGILS